MDKPYSFAERLKTIMEEKGLSNSDIARLCEIDKSNITRYLSGKYEAKQDVVYRMASKLNVAPAWLMGYDVAADGDQPAPIEDQELNEYLEELRTNPDLRMLFKTGRNMKPEQLRAVVQMLDGFQK